MILFITTNLRPQPLMLEYESHTREPGLRANFLFDPRVQRLSKYNLTIYIRAILTHAFIQKFIYYYQKTLSHRKHLLNEQNICDKEVEVLLVISQVGEASNSAQEGKINGNKSQSTIDKDFFTCTFHKFWQFFRFTQTRLSSLQNV